MSITMPCPRCDAVIDAIDEEDLVEKVQRHVREDHGLDHAMPAKHILARLACSVHRGLRQSDRASLAVLVGGAGAHDLTRRPCRPG